MRSPRQLTQPASAEEALLITLMQLGRRMRQRHAQDDIDPAAMPLLHALRCTGSMRLSDLAARLSLDASTVSRHIRQLDERGLVERGDDPDDGRASRVTLAAEGEKALAAAMERRLESFAEVLSSWSATDRERLRQLLSRFAADLARANDEHESSGTTRESA